MTRPLLIAGAAIAALSLAACGQKTETKGAATPAEQAATPDANPAATIATPADEASAPVFVEKASASDLFEVEAAKLAQATSKNAEVKKFAADMVAAHTKSTAALKKAANFDKAYLENQVDAHQSALNLMQRYAQDGDVPAIKAFAASTAPVVQQHFDHAKTLRDATK